MTVRANDANNIYLGAPDQLTTGAVSFAPEGTALPTDPSGTLNTAFYGVGFIDEDGITISGLKAQGDALRAWGGVKVRQLPGQADPTVELGIMETTREALALIVGDSNATEVAANATHGKQTKVVFNDDAAAVHTACIRLKDGDKRAIVNFARLQCSEISDIELKENGAIKWRPKFSLLGGTEHGYMEIIFDDGQKTGSGN